MASGNSASTSPDDVAVARDGRTARAGCLGPPSRVSTALARATAALCTGVRKDLLAASPSVLIPPRMCVGPSSDGGAGSDQRSAGKRSSHTAQVWLPLAPTPPPRRAARALGRRPHTRPLCSSLLLFAQCTASHNRRHRFADQQHVSQPPDVRELHAASGSGGQPPPVGADWAEEPGPAHPPHHGA